MSPALVTGLLGVVLGMRHALEPDHLAAVSTLAAERSGRTGAWLGVMWGLGHSLALLVVGGALAFFGGRMPEAVTALLEVLVAGVIIVLGVRAVHRSLTEGRVGSPAPHRHGAVEHVHSAPTEHLHLDRWTFATRPLLVGVLHGLAGSGALTALIVAELPTFSARITYLLVFGVGTTAGMTLITGLAGVPLQQLAKAPRVATGLLATAGVLSIGVGLWWGALSVNVLLAG